MDSPCTQSAADANGTLVIGTDNVDHVDVCESGTWISKFSHESKWLQYISLLQSYWHTQSELTSSDLQRLSKWHSVNGKLSRSDVQPVLLYKSSLFSHYGHALPGAIRCFLRTLRS